MEAGENTDSSNLGFLAFAFISGYSVNNFLDKLEEIAGVTWGMWKPGEKSQKDQSQSQSFGSHCQVIGLWIFLVFPSVNGGIYA